jgi:hypothetical protein
MSKIGKRKEEEDEGNSIELLYINISQCGGP